MRIIPILVACAAVAACTTSAGPDATLRVQNSSDFAIVDIRLAEVDNPSFGPNLIAGDVLLPGESITLGVDCGFFDARVIDEDGAQCDIHDLDLCLNDADWVLTNSACPVFAQVAAAKAGH